MHQDGALYEDGTLRNDPATGPEILSAELYTADEMRTGAAKPGACDRRPDQFLSV